MKEIDVLKSLKRTSRKSRRVVTYDYIKHRSKVLTFKWDWVNKGQKWTYKSADAMFVMSVECPYAPSHRPLIYLGNDMEEYNELKEYLTKTLKVQR